MKWFTGIVLLTAACATAQVPRQVSLDQAIAIGMENSKMLRVSTAKVDAAEARTGEAGTALLPSLKVEGSYKRLSDVDPFAVKVPFYPTPIVISPIVLNNYNVKVSLQQPLFTGFRLRSNAKVAEYLSEATASDHRNDQADLVLNVTTAYWTLYQTRETKRFVDENVARLETYQRDTDNLLKAGMATRNDLLKIQVQLSNARLTQIDATNDVQVALMNLNNIIGLPLETELALSSVPRGGVESPERTGQPPDSGALVARALGARPDLHAMQLRVDASRAGVTAARGGWWPQIFLGGSYYYSRPNPRYMPTQDVFKSTWEVGVTMQFDVWNWNLTGYQTDQAKAALLQNELMFSQMQDNASLEVKRYILAVSRARDKTGVARLAVDQAEENLRSTNDKFKSGLATSSDLLDANVTLLQTRTNLSGALVELELARARLHKATGEEGEGNRGDHER